MTADRPGFLRKIFYRSRQFAGSVNAAICPAEHQQLETRLTPEQLALFRQMPLDIQRHSLNVLHALHDEGYDDPDLTVAALLHDAGKIEASTAGMRLGPFMRSALVLAEAVAPGRTARLARDDPDRRWRYLLYVHLSHPALGAELARSAGCSELTCRLIAHHQDKRPPGDDEYDALLVALQRADNQN